MPPQEFTSATPGIVRSIGLTVYSWTFFSSMSDRLSDSTRYWNTSLIGVAGRQVPGGVLHPLCDLRAREVHVHVVIVGHGYDGDPSFRDRAHAARPRQSHHGRLHRVAHEVLDVVGRKPRRDGDDLHLVRREIRKGIDVEVTQRPHADPYEQQRDRDDRDPETERQRNEFFDHGITVGASSNGRTRTSRRKPPR